MVLRGLAFSCERGTPVLISGYFLLSKVPLYFPAFSYERGTPVLTMCLYQVYHASTVTYPNMAAFRASNKDYLFNGIP